MNRSVNRRLLKERIAEKGGSVTVSYEADVGHSTLEKMICGSYPAQPRKKLRAKLAAYLGVDEDLLFPVAKEKAKSA